MLPIIMTREFIARSTKMPRSIGRLSASALSHHDLSSAVFITNIAESDFRHTQQFAFGLFPWLTCQGGCVKVSRCQGVKVSRCQGVKVSRSQGVKVSRSQGVKVSRCQGVKANFHRVALVASRPVAPREVCGPQEDPCDVNSRHALATTTPVAPAVPRVFAFFHAGGAVNRR
jgi:hypothetical protein